MLAVAVFLANTSVWWIACKAVGGRAGWAHFVNAWGYSLLPVAAVAVPLTIVITPNIPEAEAILGVAIKSTSEARLAARRLKDMGSEWVVVEGGHLQDQPEDSVDIAFNGEEFIEISAKRYATANTHGTGCTYSAAITAYLALGMEVSEALRAAKDYITWAVANSLSLGHGCGATNHFYFRRSGGPGMPGRFHNT